jgi:hypothetical protein
MRAKRGHKKLARRTNWGCVRREPRRTLWNPYYFAEIPGPISPHGATCSHIELDSEQLAEVFRSRLAFGFFVSIGCCRLLFGFKSDVNIGIFFESYLLAVLVL